MGWRQASCGAGTGRCIVPGGRQPARQLGGGAPARAATAGVRAGVRLAICNSPVLARAGWCGRRQHGRGSQHSTAQRVGCGLPPAAPAGFPCRTSPACAPNGPQPRHPAAEQDGRRAGQGRAERRFEREKRAGPAGSRGDGGTAGAQLCECLTQTARKTVWPAAPHQRRWLHVHCGGREEDEDDKAHQVRPNVAALIVQAEQRGQAVPKAALGTVPASGGGAGRGALGG